MIRWILISFIFCMHAVYSQTKDTSVVDVVKVKKKVNFVLYQGVLKETENWFVVIDSDQTYYLLNLNMTEDEVIDWFKRFKNSQNIYKAIIQNYTYPTLSFEKENEPGERLRFYLLNNKDGELKLSQIETNTIYLFKEKIRFED